jgi:hypothetical protein
LYYKTSFLLECEQSYQQEYGAFYTGLFLHLRNIYIFLLFAS